VTETRGERTRAAIIDAALALFGEVGYDATTMRAVAARAGVSVGNAYYYFASKSHLVQGFYDRAAAQHGAASAERLAALTELDQRIEAHLLTWFDLFEPYRAFAGTFFRNASDPTSPLSPFSPESAPAREAAIDLWRGVIDGASSRVPTALRADLPELLWLYQMGTVLFWVHDQSAGAVATRLLVARTVPIVVRAIELSRLPALRTLVGEVLALLGDLRGFAATGSVLRDRPDPAGSEGQN
jgi:AcrR family transcriptional regulator